MRGGPAGRSALTAALGDPRLPALVAAQAAGIALADHGVLGTRAALAGGALALVAGVLLPRRRVREALALGLALCAGALALALRLASVEATRPEAPQVRTLEGHVAALRRDARGLRFDLEGVQPVDADPRHVPRRVRVYTEGEPRAGPLATGSFVRLRARLRAPTGRGNPGGFDPSRGLARAGIAATARLVDPALLVRRPARDRRVSGRLDAWRGRTGARLAASGPGGALLRALALGDASALPPGDRERFAGLGVAHLLAVSGLHVGLVAGLVYAGARRGLARSAVLAAGRDPRDASRALACVAALAYGAAAGFALPVRRALVLLSALAVAAGRAQRIPPLHPLCIAAGALLALDPAALFAPGAQLSFLACAALLASAGREAPAPGARRRAGVRGTLRASATAGAATAPLAALHFGVAAPLALPVNLVAVPWTAAVLLPAALLAAAAAAWDGPGADAVLWAAERLANGTLVALAWLDERLPHRSGVSPHPAALAIAGGLALVAVRAQRLRGALAAALAAAVGLWLAPPRPVAPPVPRLWVLDVGRGDAFVVQGRAGVLLVDAGAARPGHFDLGASTVVPALRALGVRRLDLVIASHADLDHRGGLPAVLAALPVDEVWLPWGAREAPGFAALREAARAAGAPLHERGRGSPARRVGDLVVQPLWPPRARGGSRNERSLAVRVAAGGRRVLLLGDVGRAEARLIADAGPALRADVLVLPHHGSAGSSSEALLDAVRPGLAIVSAPCPPRQGLPHASALARVRRAGLPLGWTGRDGAVGVPLEGALRPVRFAPRRCAVPGSPPPGARAQTSIESTSRS